MSGRKYGRVRHFGPTNTYHCWYSVGVDYTKYSSQYTSVRSMTSLIMVIIAIMVLSLPSTTNAASPVMILTPLTFASLDTYSDIATLQTVGVTCRTNNTDFVLFGPWASNGTLATWLKIPTQSASQVLLFGQGGTGATSITENFQFNSSWMTTGEYRHSMFITHNAVNRVTPLTYPFVMKILPAISSSLVLTSSLSFNEQTPVTWLVSLRSRPSTGITTIVITWAFDSANTGGVTSAGIDFSPSTLTFTPVNWNMKRTIIITPTNDNIAQPDRLLNMAFAVTSDDPFYAAYTIPTVPVTILDDDTGGFLLSSTSLLLTEGSDAVTVNFSLSSQPTANVIVQLRLSTTDAIQLTISPASHTFTLTNWNVPVVMHLTPIDDNVVEGLQVMNVTFLDATASADPAYSGIIIPTISVTILDNDLVLSSINPTYGYGIGGAQLSVNFASTVTLLQDAIGSITSPTIVCVFGQPTSSDDDTVYQNSTSLVRSAHQIFCDVPSCVTTNFQQDCVAYLEVTLWVNGQQMAAGTGINFYYNSGPVNKPRVTQLSPKTGDLWSVTNITIQGVYFPSTGTPSCIIGNILSSAASITTVTTATTTNPAIVCSTPLRYDYADRSTTTYVTVQISWNGQQYESLASVSFGYIDAVYNRTASWWNTWYGLIVALVGLIIAGYLQDCLWQGCGRNKKVEAAKEVKVLRGPHELAADIKEQVKTLTEADDEWLDPTDEKVIEARAAVRAAEERRKKRHADKDKMSEEGAERRKRMLARRAAALLAENGGTTEKVERSQSRSASHSTVDGAARTSAGGAAGAASGGKDKKRSGAVASVEANRERQRKNAPAPVSASSRGHLQQVSRGDSERRASTAVPAASASTPTSAMLAANGGSLGLDSQTGSNGAALLVPSGAATSSHSSRRSERHARTGSNGSGTGSATNAFATSPAVGVESKGEDLPKWADRRDEPATDSKRGSSRMAAVLAAAAAAPPKKTKRNQIQPMALPVASSTPSNNNSNNNNGNNGTSSASAAHNDEQLAIATSVLTDSAKGAPVSLERLARAAHGHADSSFDGGSDTEGPTPRQPAEEQQHDDAAAGDNHHMQNGISQPLLSGDGGDSGASHAHADHDQHDDEHAAGHRHAASHRGSTDLTSTPLPAADGLDVASSIGTAHALSVPGTVLESPPPPSTRHVASTPATAAAAIAEAPETPVAAAVEDDTAPLLPSSAYGDVNIAVNDDTSAEHKRQASTAAAAHDESTAAAADGDHERAASVSVSASATAAPTEKKKKKKPSSRVAA